MNPVNKRACVPMRLFTRRIAAFSTGQQGRFPGVHISFVSSRGDRQNSLLGPDKRFFLPGGVSSRRLEEEQWKAKNKSEARELEELHRQDSHNLLEIISGNEVTANTHFLDEMREASLDEILSRSGGDWPVELTAHPCPRLLKRDLKRLFPEARWANSLTFEKDGPLPLTVINMTQKTKEDMSAWSKNMEDERETLTAAFISSATTICKILENAGYWADFIDPSSGRPYLGEYTSYTLFETDDAYREMGFKIEDLGCCRVLKHAMWGSHAFVGTIFTDAKPSDPLVRAILEQSTEEKTLEAEGQEEKDMLDVEMERNDQWNGGVKGKKYW